MAVNRFVPAIWSSVMLTALRKSLVYAGLANTDYEGEIRGAGDTVKVTSVSRPTINNYTRNTDITYEELTDAERTLVIDQEKYFAFSVDDVDKRQVQGNFVSTAMNEAAYGLRDTIDQYMAGLYTQVNSANVISTTAITTGALAYTGLVNLGLKLDEANVPDEGRWVVVPPWYYALLLNEDKFARADASGIAAASRTGYIGMVDNMTVYKSNNAPLITGDDYAVIAGTDRAATVATQITQTEAFRSELRFADRVRGLTVYGAKLMRPDGWAYMIASKT
jgi:N4-gp56 family major capsid protein